MRQRQQVQPRLLVLLLLLDAFRGVLVKVGRLQGRDGRERAHIVPIALTQGYDVVVVVGSQEKGSRAQPGVQRTAPLAASAAAGSSGRARGVLQLGTQRRPAVPRWRCAQHLLRRTLASRR